MAKEPTQWSPEEQEANELKFKIALREMFATGEMTDEQEQQVRDSGALRGTAYDEGNAWTDQQLIDAGWGFPIMDDEGVNINPNISMYNPEGTEEIQSGGRLSFGGPPSGWDTETGFRPTEDDPILTPIDEGGFGDVPQYGRADYGQGGNPSFAERYDFTDQYIGGGGGDNALQMGGGGINVAPTGGDVGGGADWQGDPFGWEASTNKDFYQQQFQAMLAKQMRNAMREEVAGDRAREAAAAPQPEAVDPWAWANLPDRSVSTGGGGTGGGAGGDAAVSSPYNSAYNFTNQSGLSDIVNQLGDVFTPQEQEQFRTHFGTEGVNPDSSYLANAGSYEEAMSRFNAGNPDVGAEWGSTMGKLIRNLYPSQGGTTSGPGTAPPGYVSPIPGGA